MITGPELAPLLTLAFVAAMAGWVHTDAGARERRGRPVVFQAGPLEIATPVAWALACLLLCVVFLPVYLLSRD